MKKILLIAIIGVLFCGNLSAQRYFPPKVGSTWDTMSPNRLGWCQDSIDALFNFLENKNTKAFIVLKGGKMLVEKYFDAFTRDSVWYWASAGKSLTAALVGIAANDGIIHLQDSTSKYLGTGWTQCTPEEEGKIKIWHQITMTSGLNDLNVNPDCTDDTCLKYLTEPGTRWAYHNAVYHLVHDVLENASGQNINLYTAQKLGTKIGMAGLWIDHIFYSNARSMAKFGLLMLNNGKWGTETVLADTQYFKEMINTSQTMNPAYGYLWWLNGKSSYLPPRIQFRVNGSLIPTAPADLYAAMGKNDQKCYVVPSQDLVVVRLGNESGTPTLGPSSLDGELWARIGRLACNSIGTSTWDKKTWGIYPNPVSETIMITGMKDGTAYRIMDASGRQVMKGIMAGGKIEVSNLSNGIYSVDIGGTHNRFIKQ